MSEATGPDRTAILKALDEVIDPKSGKGLASAGLVRGLVLRSGRAAFMLEVAPSDIDLYRAVRDRAEEVLAHADGVETAQVVLTSELQAPSTPQLKVSPRRPQPGETPPARRARIAEDPQAQLHPMVDAVRPPHVKKVIAIASGKGGVGKSTVSTNLAAAFAVLGQRVGLLDADIYGPSAPTMLGVDGDPTFDADKRLNPMEAWGVKVMSIGFIVEPGTANIWRGPMASSALRSLLNSNWGTEAEPLDVLVIDLPPGTGDIQLTLVQKLKMDGVVIVSTPQEIALIDARRAAQMFEKTGAPILGVVENMAYFADSSGVRVPIFGEGGARREAERLGVPLLAEIPIEVPLREACDAGRPLVATNTESAAAQAFLELARKLS
ncbi:MAG: sodium:proton antiporter [Phenylobacterium sp. RIFCSPHIGHO2_01_FULL_69_31]|uniref:Mrp/NBP35 family ATP-binding protein n=1 Tax=Phenylobacterium sp. RIFCSPHIGHO2_01_FULL_69_31 TaxID=1801944 RepID=UPI0008B95391|nr:Mrp/NBP35 family ATP-binding protein [Phenylobacterium sp. RIFCSPHIGHO2_01_FULL_69_31]OHB28875.1 MAG: sodium:proton antiporter [Phenylobacterium sp. RIFCSPHIGHO2_01_FULL_69_31]